MKKLIMVLVVAMFLLFCAVAWVYALNYAPCIAL